LDWLSSNCQLVALDDLARRALGDVTDKPTVSITFDDGYEDNWSVVLPILSERGIKATFFLTTGFIDGQPTVAERFARERRTEPGLRPLSWSQVRDLREAGMSVGSHTVTHRNLARLTETEVEAELSDSKNRLEEMLEMTVNSLAYPYGKPRSHVTRAVAGIAATCGYRLAVTTSARRVDRADTLLELPRLLVSSDNVATLAAKVRGSWDIVGIWQEYSPRWLSQIVSPHDFRIGL